MERCRGKGQKPKGGTVSHSEQKDKKKKSGKLPQGFGKVLGYGFILIFLLTWVFTLGVLTGRGDVHHWLQRLGLYQSEMAARLGVAPANPESPAQPILPAVAAPKNELESAKTTGGETKPPAPSQAEAQPAEKGGQPPNALPPGDSAKKPESHTRPEDKKAKVATPAKTAARDSIAAKLNFQNSLDTQPRKAAKTAAHKERGVQTAAMTPGASGNSGSEAAAAEKKKAVSAYQVKVASYRTAAEAQKALADLTKRGFKVNLQQSKDKTGPTFVIQSQRYQSKAEAEKVAKKLREANMAGQVREVKP